MTTGAYIAPGTDIPLNNGCSSLYCHAHQEPKPFLLVVSEEHKPTPVQSAAYKMMSSDPQRKAAAEVLSKVLENIIEHPTEAKYR